MKKIFGISLVIGVLTWSCINDEEPEYTSLLPGDECPQFRVEMSDGRTFSTSNFKGIGGMIVFFNTDCGDCRRELPEIQKVYEYLDGKGLLERIICIAREEDDAQIDDYWSSTGLTLPYSPQPDRKIYNLFASGGIPRVYVIDKDLTITSTFDDDPMPSAEQLINLIANL